jgi:hypothetical protein
MSDQKPRPDVPERQRYRRYRLVVGVTLGHIDGRSGAMQGLLQEISEGGMSAFFGAGELKVEDIVNVNLALPSGRMHFRAVVRRQRGRQFGFEFIDLTPEQLQQIKTSHLKMQPFISKVIKAGSRLQ